MKNRYVNCILWILLVSICNFSFSQTSKTNPSIEAQLRLLRASSLDSNRVNILNQIGKLFVSISPDSARTYAQRAFSKAETLNYEDGMFASNHIVGLSYYAESNYDKAIAVLENGLRQIDRSKKPSRFAKTTVMIAQIKGDAGLEDAIPQLRAILPIVDSLNDLETKGKIFAIMGGQYFKQQKTGKAKECFESARPILDSLGSTALIVVEFGLSQCYERIGELDHAMEYALSALVLSEKYGNTLYNIKIRTQLILLYCELDRGADALIMAKTAIALASDWGAVDMVAALKHEIGANAIGLKGLSFSPKDFLEDALRIYREIDPNGFSNIGIVHNSLSRYYHNNKDFDKAISHADSAISYLECADNAYGTKAALVQRSMVFSMRKKYKLGLIDLKRAIRIAEKEGLRSDIPQLWLEVASLQEKAGDFKMAFNSIKFSNSLSDSLEKDGIHVARLEMEAKYNNLDLSRRVAEKNVQIAENEVSFLQEQKKKNQFKLIFWISILLLTFLGSFTWLTIRSKQKLKLYIEEIKRQNALLVQSDKDKGMIIRSLENQVEQSPLIKEATGNLKRLVLVTHNRKKYYIDRTKVMLLKYDDESRKIHLFDTERKLEQEPGGSLIKLLGKFGDDLFVRINSQQAINRKMVKVIEEANLSVLMCNDDRYEVTRYYMKKIIEDM